MGNYKDAELKYAKQGIDTENALKKLGDKPISINCWQGDDVAGFDSPENDVVDGLRATGNYPGKARNFAELTADFDKACELIPGKKRLNLHASYAVFEPGERVSRDRIEYRHFAPWAGYAKKRGIGLDFNPTCFGHSNVRDGLTLSSPDQHIQQFWIGHCIQSRRIADAIGRELSDVVLCNVWIPDGFKDIPADRIGPRLRLKSALDRIFEQPLENVVDCVESKLFGVGLESCTVGSLEFYLGYASRRKGVYCLLDNGHFHPTETVSDKISSLLCFFDKLPLHITRPVRWDSDHVPLFDDETRDICKEIVRCGALDKALIGLDFFDASINRIAAWVLGTRSVHKSLLYALLQPDDKLVELQDAGDFTQKLVRMEEMKTLPFGDVWNEYCARNNVPYDGEWMSEIVKYEQNVLRKRG
ncbi:MAG: L-rhamnose isomerase [Oscillospiraceae bacterium]|nr:L-rhamnose isomerase [Oscillospiraceae bacterium]